MTPSPPPRNRRRRGFAGAAPLGALLLLVAACEGILTEPFQYAEVEVEAVRRSGDPVPGVALVLYTGTRHLGYAVTGEDGRALFTLVPAGIMGVSAAPDAALYRPLDLAGGYSSTFRMEEGEDRSVAFTYLKFGPGEIHARVVDTEGAPIVGVLLQVYTPQKVVAEQLTDAQGEVHLSALPFGPYGVRAIPGRGFTVPAAAAVADGLFVEDGVTEEAHFRFERCLGAVTVTARTPEGAPFPDLTFTLYEPGEDGQEGVTGQDGSLRFAPLPCGNYGVRFHPVVPLRAVSPASGYLDGLLLGHKGDLQAPFTIVVCRGTIRVLVQDGAGTPVPGARVELYLPTGTLESKTVGADGLADFDGLPCRGEYAVRVVPPEGAQVGHGRGRDFFDGIVVDDPGAVLDFTFTLSVCRATIRARVQDPSGNAVPGARVEVYVSTGALETKAVGADGRVDFDGLLCRPGYGVRVIPPAGWVVGPGTAYFDGIALSDPGSVRDFTFTLTRP